MIHAEHTYQQLEQSVTPSLDGVFLCPDEGEIPRIVLTGGPGSGKTTLLNELQANFQTYGYVKEAATEVINGGWAMPDDEHPWTQQWQDELQQAIAAKQFELEAQSAQEAHTKQHPIIIQDRGLLDLGAYLHDTDAIERYLNGLSIEQAGQRYHTVVHLGTIANRAYERESNQARFEDQQRAHYLGEKLIDCWKGHRNFIQITSSEHRLEQMEEIIKEVHAS